MGRRMSEIRQHAQLCRAIGATELHGFSRVVRHGKRRELQAAQIDGFAVARQVKQAVEIG